MPRQGVHSFRIFNIAVFDVLLSFALAYVVNLVGDFQNYWLILLYTFIAGVFMHWLFCVDTTTHRLLCQLSNQAQTAVAGITSDEEANRSLDEESNRPNE